MLMKNLTTLKKLPGVMAFRRGHVVSDAEMFNIFDDKDPSPVFVFRHGIRGVQNVNEGKGNANPWEKAPKTGVAGERSVSNIQTTDSAKVASDAKGMLVRFEMRFLNIEDLLDSCSSSDKENQKMARETIADFLERAKKSDGLYEIACRYARNIANGRWLWRNSSMASSIEISVYEKSFNKKEAEKKRIGHFSNALDVPRKVFDNYSPEEKAVANEILRQMKGESLSGLIVEAHLHFSVSGAFEVYPSQNYIEKKRTDKGGGLTKSLYKLNYSGKSDNDDDDIKIVGRAAIRDQKIFNAIRTIDTWYPRYEEVGVPIAVEPLGANLSLQDFYRPGKHCSFEIALRLAQLDPNSNDGMFMIAAIERGGVYGDSDKKKEESSEEPAEKTMGDLP